jgi:membrane fusion protein, copper/silver efflux system
MNRTLRSVVILAALAAAGIVGFRLGRTNPTIAPGSLQTAPIQAAQPVPGGPVIYYRDPDGKPFYSAGPKATADGRPYRAVRASEDIGFDENGETVRAGTKTEEAGSRRILYYRNPMGLPDVSTTPKKDWMGMDYIPVYDGEAEDDGKTVRVSLDKIQRIGVRTEAVQERAVIRPIRAVGTVKPDEGRMTVVTLRSDGFIEDLFVNKTGQHVRAGEPLFRVYSPQIQQAQTDLIVATRSTPRGALAAEADRSLEGAMQRLRNLGVPEGRIREVRETGTNPRTIDWLSPAAGDVTEKRIVNGQRVAAGDELYRIVDHAHVWVIADVAEADLAAVRPGTRASVTLRAYPLQPIEAEVTLVYPELRAETRTGRVRIDVPNGDGRLRIDMYADVLFRAGAEAAPVVAVPDSALIDSGTRQVVLIAKGEGRFEPRAVKPGRRGDGYVEIVEGLSKGEEVVTAATFLIDAESNLRAALQAFTQAGMPK